MAKFTALSTAAFGAAEPWPTVPYTFTVASVRCRNRGAGCSVLTEFHHTWPWDRSWPSAQSARPVVRAASSMFCTSGFPPDALAWYLPQIAGDSCIGPAAFAVETTL